jgi:DNA-3-methyladenine glycosylase II/AraC family transcriptional regulator of adaptative response / DNA-3-methyladenine glycosylase II
MRLDRGVTSDLVDLAALRAFLVVHAVPGLDDVEVLADGATRHRRLFTGGGGAPSTLTVTLPAGAVGAPLIDADGPTDAVAAATAVGLRWLGLDADPAPGVAALADDPVLGPLVRARPHLRVPGSTDAFETAVLVVLGQHVSLAAGRAFAARLVAAHGTRVGEIRAFPAPEVLAALDPTALRHTVGITGARARTVVAIAGAVAHGTLALRAASTPDLAETRRALLALPGVGPWTADLVALRALRDPDVFLPGDLVVRKALGGVTAKAAEAMADAWRPHRSLAVLHLWTHHAIDPPR